MTVDKNIAYYQGCAGEILPDEIHSFKFPKDRALVVEEKYDGIWCAVVIDENGKVTLMSRNVKEKDNEQLQSLREHIEKNYAYKNSVFAGELAFSSQTGTEWARVHGHHKIDIFDVLIINGEDATKYPLLARKAALKELFYPDSTWVPLAPHYFVTKNEDIERLYKEVVGRGGEGVIVKDPADRDYRFGSKSPFWYKVKKEVTIDYVIMGFTETKSKAYAAKGYVGGVIGGLYKNGSLVEVCTIGSMNDSWRSEFFKYGENYIGKVMECKGNEVFKSGALRHPSFVNIRLDKNPEECVHKGVKSVD